MFSTTLALILISSVLSTADSRHTDQLSEEVKMEGGELVEDNGLTVQANEEEGAFFGWMYRGREVNQ